MKGKKVQAYVSTLWFWAGNSCFQRAPPILPFVTGISHFCDYPGLNVRYFWIFKADHVFYKLGMKILVTSNEIKLLPSWSWAADPCQIKPLLFWH